MSAAKNGRTKEARAGKEPTASQLFIKYMAAVERIRGLAMRLDKELAESQSLSDELETRFGVYVSGKEHAAVSPPALVPKTVPALAPVQPTENAAEQEPTPEGEYEPPPQTVTAEAPRLTGKESAIVAKIRADSSLSPDQAEDAEALAMSGGPGRLAKLQAAMGGIPAVVPSPGAVEHRGSPDPGPDNTEGGPVRQGPVPEDK